MSTNINKGNQERTFYFKEEMTSVKFNKVNYGLHSTGIYLGGEFVKISNTEIEVTPMLVAFEEKVEEMLIRIKTTENVSVQVAPATPYIVARYTWVALEENYMDIVATAYASLEADDIILGKLKFDGSNLSEDYDYSRKGWSEEYYRQRPRFKVYASEPYDDRVMISPGKVFYNNKTVELTVETQSPQFTFPITSGRIDLVCIDSNDNTVKILTGVDSATPKQPDIYENYLIVGKVTFPSGATVVSGDYIETIELDSMYNFKSSDNVYNNIKIGYNALFNNITGDNNIAIGRTALLDNTIGRYNTAIGISTLLRNTTGNNNTAIGASALFNNTTGISNIAIGASTLLANTIGRYNTAIGTSALFNNTTGDNNVAIGYRTLYLNTVGKDNIAIGKDSLITNVTGINNISLGTESLFNSVGDGNTAIGYQALYNTTTGYGNIAIGETSLYNNTIGYHNIAIGYALFSNTTGNKNVAIGFTSLYTNTTGQYNIAIGDRALYTTNADYNIAFGRDALYLNTTGNNNISLGAFSLDANTIGYNNVAVGHQALTACTTGDSNTALGYQALNTTTTGVNNTAIGNGAVASSATVSNTITLGNASVTTLRCQVTTITSLSDKRDKADITDIELGLDFINKLKPRKFKWDRREWYATKDENGNLLYDKHGRPIYDKTPDGSKKEEKWTEGFIAQEVQKVVKEFDAEWLNLVYEDNPERLEVSPGKILIPLVKAVQELYIMNKDLEKQLKDIKESKSKN